MRSMNEIPQLADVLTAELETLICCHCAEHWMAHSFAGNFCPDPKINGFTVRRWPRTTFLEVPKEVN